MTRNTQGNQKMTPTINPEDFNQSTGLSWFWALLFGPLYYIAHGFWKQAALVFLLNLVLIGFIVSPFLAYPAWEERAKADAEKERMLRALEGRA
jgi:hypothetical protein